MVYQTVVNSEDIPPELFIDGMLNFCARFANQYNDSAITFETDDGKIYMEFEDEVA